MKCIKAAALDELLYADRHGVVPAKVEDRHFTVRQYLLYLLDLPLAKEPMTRKLSKSIDRVYGALQDGDALLEDADFTFLSERIDTIGIPNKHLYDAITELLDGAKEPAKVEVADDTNA